jgi:hypothetical protein
MKFIKRLTLFMSMLTVSAFVLGCNSDTVSGSNQPSDGNTIISTTTTTTTATSTPTTEPIINDLLSGELCGAHPVQNIKRPWEYVADSEAKADEEGWILLNEYARWDNMEISSDAYAYSGTGYATEDNSVLEIHAIELVFENNRFDVYGYMTFRVGKGMDLQSMLMIMAAPYWKEMPIEPTMTHGLEFYEDADLQIPATRLYAELDQPIRVKYLANFEYEYNSLPDVNKVVEIRLWGKLADLSS